MAALTVTDTFAELRQALADMERAHEIASAVQWEKSPAPPAARDDTTERSLGGPISDPTLDVVADERRLRVRAEVRRAEKLGRWMLDAARTVQAGLDDAVTAWEGKE